MADILTKLVVDCATNESQEIELTKAEIAEIKKAAIASQTRLDNELAEATTKSAARQAIADRLGLTADELAILLG
jgi:hypothetical protein